MNSAAKISPAFDPFLADSGPNDKRDAIVIYRAPGAAGEGRVRGRLRELQTRLDYVKERAAAQRPVEEKLSEDYQKAGGRRHTGEESLEVEPIGSSVLPMANVEVTRRTLSALAQQPEVVAILPNQRIHLIQPQFVQLRRDPAPGAGEQDDLGAGGARCCEGMGRPPRAPASTSPCSTRASSPITRCWPGG